MVSVARLTANDLGVTVTAGIEEEVISDRAVETMLPSGL